MSFPFSALLALSVLLSIAPAVNAQVVVVRRRRSAGPIVAGCVVGGLFFLSLLAMCCILARRRRTRVVGGRSIEDPSAPNACPGASGGGTRIVAVRTRPMFWGRRRGLFRGPRVVAVGSWGGAPGSQQHQCGGSAPVSSADLPTKDGAESVTKLGVALPPAYGGQVREEAIKGEDSYGMSPVPTQPAEVHHKESSNFVGGFKP